MAYADTLQFMRVRNPARKTGLSTVQTANSYDAP